MDLFYKIKRSLYNLKKTIKKFLIIKYNYISSFLISNFGFIRYIYFVRQIKKYNNKNFKVKENNIAIIYEDRIKNLVEEFYSQNDLGIIIFPRVLLSQGFSFFLRKYNKDRNNLPYGEYDLDIYRSEKYKTSRKQYINYCNWINKIFSQKYNCQNILIPKCNDDWAIDYIKACEYDQMKVFIDDREGASTPRRNKIMPQRLRGINLNFEIMTTQNLIHKKVFVDSGFDENKIIINGAVQSDYWFKPDIWEDLYDSNIGLEKNKIKILFFSFGPRTYMYFYYGNEQRTWAPLSRDIHDIISQILKTYGEKIQIIYKFSGKIKRDSSDDLRRFMSLNKKYINNKSLIFLGANFSSMDLIRHSQIIIGFQTTGMIEAMNTSAQIIYTAWGDLYQDIESSLLPIANPKCLDICNSKENFLNLLNEGILRELKNKKYEGFSFDERKKLIEKFFTYSDGNVSKRLVKLISSKIS